MSIATVAPVSIWEAAHEVDADRPRSRQTQLGASDTVCQRRAAYILAGTAPTDDADKRMAILGTYIHEGLLSAARTRYRWQVERSVADEWIRGHIDAVQFDEATARRLPERHRPRVHATASPEQGVVVEDLKTKSTFVWDRVLKYGATAAELRQIYTYARLLRTAGFENVKGQRHLARLGPIPVRTLRFRFVNRDNGAEHTQTFRYDERAAEHARWWVEQVRGFEDPDTALRDFDGPGLDGTCDHCPFRTRCWPPADPPGAAPQSVLVRDDADRATALADYERGQQLESRGGHIRKLARAKLDASPPGIYGDHQLTWTGGNAKREPDTEAMLRLFREAGLPIPTTPDLSAMTAQLKAAGVAVPERDSRSRTPRTINVTRAPAN
ncbi:PD-(D/E)XK nuclease family protein [Streptacidiphilus anmyonensis]|uniref:PD-(D/E)XK nuclease family protein n=1 Tax=Streptacidiphilus anmyonensis TaxID=405782 RepID=UPI0005A78E60|nr:PD-(D/E)XK nuclease family protein [Streptacidiphilus anmyonensis]